MEAHEADSLEVGVAPVAEQLADLSNKVGTAAVVPATARLAGGDGVEEAVSEVAVASVVAEEAVEVVHLASRMVAAQHLLLLLATHEG